MLRFSASPTSDMHIGDLRVALFNYIVSKQNNENLLVRIEDSDKEKNTEGKDQEILDLLELFGIKYSQVIYQSQNVRFYTAMALQLMHEKKAFSCFCSKAWLDKKKQEAKEAKKPYKYDDACENLPDELVIDNPNPFTIRIKKPTDNISKDIDSFVILKQDKTPTYNFASAVDDMLNDISIVVCNENHMDDMLKQEHIRNSLNYDKKIKYIYLQKIINEDEFSVKRLLKEGYLPEAILNYLISIDNKTPKKIFSVKEAVEWFNLDNISNSPTRFDIEILKDINKQHLKNLDSKELSRYVGFADEEIGEVAKVYLEEVTTTKELKNKIEPIFKPKIIPSEFKKDSLLMVETIKKAPYFEKYDDFKNYIMKESGLKEKDFFKLFGLLLTGSENTPDLKQLYKYLKNYLGEIIK